MPIPRSDFAARIPSRYRSRGRKDRADTLDVYAGAAATGGRLLAPLVVGLQRAVSRAIKASSRYRCVGWLAHKAP